MSSFSVLVAIIGVTVGIATILFTGYSIYSDRLSRRERLRELRDEDFPRFALQPGVQGDIELRRLDAPIDDLTLDDYVSSFDASRQVDEHIRRLGILRQLRDLLRAESKQEQGDHPIRLDLRGLDLSRVVLRDIRLTDVVLRGANLSHTQLIDIDLRRADLSETNLTGAYLENTHLRDVKLKGANLTNANLAEATGITNDALEQQAVSLKGAVMPDGSTHD